jgi:hypothetical protein
MVTKKKKPIVSHTGEPGDFTLLHEGDFSIEVNVDAGEIGDHGGHEFCRSSVGDIGGDMVVDRPKSVAVGTFKPVSGSSVGSPKASFFSGGKDDARWSSTLRESSFSAFRVQTHQHPYVTIIRRIVHTT